MRACTRISVTKCECQDQVNKSFPLDCVQNACEYVPIINALSRKIRPVVTFLYMCMPYMGSLPISNAFLMSLMLSAWPCQH